MMNLIIYIHTLTESLIRQKEYIYLSVSCICLNITIVSDIEFGRYIYIYIYIYVYIKQAAFWYTIIHIPYIPLVT